MAEEYDPLGLGIPGIGADTYSAAGFLGASAIDLTGGGDARSRDAQALVSNSAARKRTVAEVVDLLRARRGRHSWADFVSFAAVDIAAPANAKLLDDLKRNSKVELDTASRTIAYKPTLGDVKDRRDIVLKVQQHPFGISELLFEDAYIGVEIDLKQVVAEGDILQLSSQQTAAAKQAVTATPAAAAAAAGSAARPAQTSTQKKDSYSLLFPRRRQYEVAMSPALVSAWQSCSVPSNPADLDELLVRHGLMTAAQARAALLAQSALATLEIKRKKKLASLPQRKRYRQQHLTNTHLVGEKGYDFLKQTNAGSAQRR